MDAIKKETSGEISEEIVLHPEAKVNVVIPLAQTIEELVVVRSKLKELEEEFEQQTGALKSLRDKLTASAVEEMKKTEQLSARFQKATASLAVRKTIKVIDERAAVQELKAKELHDYVSESLNDLFYETYAKEIAKGNATLPGIEVRETEYLSIRTSDKEERRKVTTNEYKEIK